MANVPNVPISARRPNSARSTATQTGISPNEMIPVLMREARRYQIAIAGTFATIALLALLFGLFVLPRKYTATTTIQAQESDIIQPLLAGRAVSTEVIDRAGIARQVIFSGKVMNQILAIGGWLGDKPSAQMRDRLIEQIRDRTRIVSPRPNLIRIEYHDDDPERTFNVTRRMAELMIEETLENKAAESREAYEFIDKQVSDYHDKLTEAENNLQAYRSANADAQPGSATDVNTRIGALRTQVEQARMSLMEQRSSESALTSQLSGESAVTAVQTRENLYRTQLIELQNQLDTLLLSYTDKHPDVIRVRHQMDDIQAAMQQEQQRRERSTGNEASAEARANPLYQELRSRLADTRRGIAATASRMTMSQSMLDEELGRSRRIAASDSTLAELTRDYEVNRDIYQDLLRRRENARVSMQLDREHRGLTMRIQDPAELPVRPTGLGMSQVALGGLAAGVALPLGLLFLLVRFDPRLRSPHQLERQSGYPLLTVVPSYRTQRDRRRELIRIAISISLVLAAILAYGLVYGYKRMHT